MCRRIVFIGNNNWMSRDPTIKFGLTIKNLRSKQEISQETLAERAGVHRNYIGLIERGERTPNLVNIVKLAKGLGIKASELLSSASL